MHSPSALLWLFPFFLLLMLLLQLYFIFYLLTVLLHFTSLYMWSIDDSRLPTNCKFSFCHNLYPGERKHVHYPYIPNWIRIFQTVAIEWAASIFPLYFIFSVWVFPRCILRMLLRLCLFQVSIQITNISKCHAYHDFFFTSPRRIFPIQSIFLLVMQSARIYE